MPHRNVQNTEAFAILDANDLANEYLEDQHTTNKKYLSSDGDSKVLIVSGTVFSIDVDKKQTSYLTFKRKCK